MKSSTTIPKSEIRKNVATYLILTLFFCLPVYYMCIRTGKLGGGIISYATIVMWCPAIAALLTCRIRRIPISSLGWKWGATRYQILAYCIPLLYSLIPYLMIWISGVGGFYEQKFVTEMAQGMGWNLPDILSIPLYILLMSSFGMVRSVGSALGEEVCLPHSWQESIRILQLPYGWEPSGRFIIIRFCYFPITIQEVPNGWH